MFLLKTIILNPIQPKIKLKSSIVVVLNWNDPCFLPQNLKPKLAQHGFDPSNCAPGTL